MANYKFLIVSFLSILGFYTPITAAQFPLSASYTINSSWSTGYQVTVTLKNNSSTPTSSWTSTFSLGEGQSITNLWNGNFQANGQSITVTNPTWFGGGIIPARWSTTFGFIVSKSASSNPTISNLQAVANGNFSIQAPVLQPINNPAGANQFQLQWNAVANATEYMLQQSLNSSFTNPQTVFNGAATSALISVEVPGIYYYRVTASSSNAISPTSNIVSTIVNNSPTQPSNYFIESYWESWNSDDSIAGIINMHVDNIDIAFANFATTGDHIYTISGVECLPETLAQFVTLTHNAGKKVKVSIGGATYPLSPQLKTTQDAIGMAQAIAQYIQQNNLDGVDFDIEDYPAPELQVALIQNTRQLLGNNKLITYTPKSPASTTSPYYEVIQNAHQYLDGIMNMGYDYEQGYSYSDDVQALISMGIPAAKISIGLMPGMDDLGVMTSVADITTAAQYIKQNNLLGFLLAMVTEYFCVFTSVLNLPEPFF